MVRLLFRKADRAVGLSIIETADMTAVRPAYTLIRGFVTDFADFHNVINN